MKGISGKMNMDRESPYAINAQLKKERVGNAHKFSPSLEVKLPNKQPITVSGMFMYNGNRQFDVEFNMNRVTPEPVKATGKVFKLHHRTKRSISKDMQSDQGFCYLLL